VRGVFWRKKPGWPNLGIIIIHDTVTHHTAQMTKKWFTQCGWEVFRNSSHRRGLLPLDFKFIDLSKKVFSSGISQLVPFSWRLTQISLWSTPMSQWGKWLGRGGGYVEKWCISVCMCKGDVKFTLERALKAQRESTHRAVLFP
jgi:hypothetical protein